MSHFARSILQFTPAPLLRPFAPLLALRTRYVAYHQAKEALPFIQGIIKHAQNVCIIDAGFHKGYVTALWMKKLPLNTSFRGFEIRKELRPYAQQLTVRHPHRDIQVQFCAFGTRDGFVDYFDSSHAGLNDFFSQGATVMPGKKTGHLDYAVPKKVQSVDAVQVISQIHHSLKAPAALILKLDIEGAEYDVLERILDSGRASLLSGVVVDWHAHHFTWDRGNALRERQIRIEKNLKDLGIPLFAPKVSPVLPSLTNH